MNILSIRTVKSSIFCALTSGSLLLGGCAEGLPASEHAVALPTSGMESVSATTARSAFGSSSNKGTAGSLAVNTGLLRPVSLESSIDSELDRIVKSAGRKYRARVGVAITSAEGTFTAGEGGTSPAWSTIKVPIAIAALSHGAPKDVVDPTIKESDNNTAWQLWSLIQAQEANPINAVNRVLKDGHSTAYWDQAILSGDGSGGNVAFGYVKWPLAEQSKFGAYLRCVPKSYYVVRDMDKIVDWQRYGLTDVPQVRAKSGWGLDELTGYYTHRQVGMLLVPGGTIGIAITTVRYQGSKEGEEVSFQKSKETLEDVSTEVLDLLTDYRKRGLLTPTTDC